MIKIESKTRGCEKNTIAGFPGAIVANGATCTSNLFIDKWIGNNPSVYVPRLSLDYPDTFSDHGLPEKYLLAKPIQVFATDDLNAFDKLSCRHSVEFAKIKRFYSLENESDLRDYLDYAPYLYSVLINASHIIINRLGKDAYASLELYRFVDGNNRAIFLTVKTDGGFYDIEDDVVNSILSYSPNSAGKLVVSFI